MIAKTQFFIRRRALWSTPGALVLMTLASSAQAQNAPMQPARDFGAPLKGDQKIHHVLNRLAFGPRPGDFENVRQIGVERWIDLQLAPEKIDDAAINQKLSVLKTLQMSPQTLTLALLRDKGQFVKKAKEMQRQKEAVAAGAKTQGEMVQMNRKRREALAMIEQSDMEGQTSVQAIGELQLDKSTRAIESQRQLFETMVDFWSNHFNLDVKKNAVRVLKVVDEREVIRRHALGSFRQLLGASAKSPAMLVYLDNASSTREVDMNAPGARRYQQRRMQQNENQNAPQNPDTAAPPKQKKRGGINENYARELMELHTLGVDGGYTQKDVQEVARCFTGWTVNRETGEFMFRAFAHDDGEKTVLGQVILSGGGIKDGERVLDILAAHPATAKFLAHKLCVRFVADEPPQSLIDKAAKTFTQTRGDLRAVLKTIFTSPEFFSTGAYRAKIKSPFEYAVSSVRALGGTVLMPTWSTPGERVRLIADGGAVLNPNKGRYMKAMQQKTIAMHIADMGQPLFSYQAPTGYSEDSREWVSTGALVSRLNYALALVGNDIYNVVATPTSLLKGVDEHDRAAITNRLLDALVGGEVSSGTRSTLARETAGEGPIDRMKLTALILGAPEFQRR